MKHIALLFTGFLFLAICLGQHKKVHTKKHPAVHNAAIKKPAEKPDTISTAPIEPVITPVQSSGPTIPVYVYICIGIIVLAVIMYFVGRDRSGSGGGPQEAKGFFKVFTPNGLQLVRKLQEMHANNLSLRMLGELELYEQMFGKIEASENPYETFSTLIGLDGMDNEPENSLKSAAWYYLTIGLLGDLQQRYDLQYRKLTAVNEMEALQKFNLNIYSDELIYLDVHYVDWNEEKTITSSYNYGGLQYRFNLGHGLSYRMGNLSVSPNTSQQFTIVDRGKLYITNKRLIFVGENRHVNKTLPLDNILELSIFQNGILIGKPNGVKPLLQFPAYVPDATKPSPKRDALNWIVIVLNRVIQKTQDEDLTPPQANSSTP